MYHSFDFDETKFIFSFVACTFNVISKDSLLNPTSLKLFFFFFLKVLQFYLLYLDFWSVFFFLDFLISFELIFVYGLRVQLPSFVYGYPVFPASFVKKPFTPIDGLGNVVKNDLTTYMRIYFWALYFVPLVGLFLCQCHTVLIIVALSLSLETRSVRLSTLFFISKIIWAIQGPLGFYISFKMGFLTF